MSQGGRKVLARRRIWQNGRRGRPPGRPVAVRRCIERAQEHVIKGPPTVATVARSS